MIKTNSKSIIILISSTVFVFLILYLLSNIKPQEELPGISLPTITIVPTPTITKIDIVNIPPPLQQQNLLPKLIKFLPYDSPEFSIEYYSSSQAFLVTIKENPLQENKKLAQQWFTTHGVTNLSDLKIIYNNYKWVE